MTSTRAPHHLFLLLLLLCALLVPACHAAHVLCSQDEVQACLPDHITSVKTLSQIKCSSSGKACVETLQQNCVGKKTHSAISKIADYKAYSCSALGLSDYNALVACFVNPGSTMKAAFDTSLKLCNNARRAQISNNICSAYKTYDLCIELAFDNLCTNTAGRRFWDKFGDLLETYNCFKELSSDAAYPQHKTKLVMAAWVGVLSYIFF